jgi:putative peptidoglycan lipid II flippase
MAATLGSQLLGFLREVVNAKYYGTQWQMDTFLAASVIPTILFGVFQGALVSALIPTFSEYLATERREEAWRLASTIVNLLGLIFVACAILGYVFAPWYVPVIAHGFPKPQMGVAIHMTRFLMPSVVAVALSGVFSGILNAFRRFRAAAIVGTVLNVVTIACVILLNHRFGIYALVFGTALGLTAQALVQLPAFLSLGGYRFIIDIHHPGLRRMWTLLGPIAVGSAAGQLAMFFDRFFASTLSPGYIAGMNYASKVVNFPQAIFATAIATVIFPLIAVKFAQENREGVAHSTTMGLRLVNFITIPSVCALVVLAHPIVQTLFERGSFGRSSVDLTAGLLPFAAVGLFAIAANVVLTRCLFACRQTAWPVSVSVGSVVLNVILSMTWLPSLGARGLLLANSVSQTAQMLCLFVLVARLVAHLDWRALGESALKVAASALVMVLVLNWIASLGVQPQVTLASRAWFLAGQIAIGALSFLAVARVLNVEELALAWKQILARFERNVIPPPESREAPIA